MGKRYVHDIQKQRIGHGWEKTDKIAALILPYAENIALHCYSDIHRQSQSKLFGYGDGDWALQGRLAPLISSRRSLETHFHHYSSRAPFSLQEQTSLYHRFRAVLDRFREVEADLKVIHLAYVEEEQSSNASMMSDVMYEQKEETMESNRTAVKTGRLATLATVFLPLSVTTSLLGMNLQTFGTGNIPFWTFAVLVILAYSFAALPFFFEIISFLVNKRILQVIEVSYYSPWAAFIFGTFCLCHGKKTNDHLWDSGLSWDINWFKGGAKRPRKLDENVTIKNRQNLHRIINKRGSSQFPDFWRTRVEQLFLFIDNPGWEKNRWRGIPSAHVQRDEDPNHLA